MGPGIPRFSYSRGAFIGGVRVPYSSFFMPKYRLPDIDSYQYESDKGRYYNKPQYNNYKPPSKNYTGNSDIKLINYSIIFEII